MDIAERKQLSVAPIEWMGDLLDDCVAEWAGLMLRAEWMDEEWWWWVVYDLQRDGIIIESSNRYDESFIGGVVAREKAESVARKYIERLTSAVVGQFFIKDVFKITGRGLVFVGQVKDGLLSPGNFIEFSDGHELECRVIKEIDGAMRTSSDEIQSGILIEFKDESEIDYFRQHVTPNQLSLVFNR